MKRTVYVVVPLLLLAVGVPLVLASGEPGRCTATAQECLDSMVKTYRHRGWIGVELTNESGLLTITRVVPDSPAEASGLEPGDVLFAVSGVEYIKANNDKLGEIRKEMTPGKVFTFTILKHGEDRQDVDIKLGKFPDDILAQVIGQHMLEQHARVDSAE
jgi:carboxyl-terminal processing protease